MSNRPTIFHSHSTYDLLHLCEDKRAVSPLIEELCGRLEKQLQLLSENNLVDNNGYLLETKPTNVIEEENVLYTVSCPVCLADNQHTAEDLCKTISKQK